MKIISLFVLLLLVGCSGKSPHSPWHGFIYAETARGEETRIYDGDFVTLTNCMEMMQAKTKYNGFGYFCGYNCPGYNDPYAYVTCEKVVGSPIGSLKIKED